VNKDDRRASRETHLKKKLTSDFDIMSMILFKVTKDGRRASREKKNFSRRKKKTLQGEQGRAPRQS
jgi:hypothetical protein